MASIYLYDTSLFPLPSTTTGVSVDVFDDLGRFVITYTPATLGVGFGATINQPDRHDLYVHDGGTYAATTLERMNGNHNYRIDLVLLPLPIPAGLGGSVSTANLGTFGKYLEHQVTSGRWTSEEAAGVVSTVAFVQHATMKRVPDRRRAMLIDSVTLRLDALGIQIA